MIDGVINCPKSPTTEPRCHSDQVDPLVNFERTGILQKISKDTAPPPKIAILYNT